jgi:hypothetical protein
MANTTTLSTQLSDMTLLQKTLLDSEQILMAATDDNKIRERLEGIMKSDRENLNTLESMTATNGSASAAREITQTYAEAINQMMNSSDLTLYDKFFQLELCKHQQTMTGLVVHKAAQSLNDELQNAVEPLNEINFENRAHQEILKGVLYFVGTREIAGKEPDMGLWASIEQGVAALKGAVGSAVS